MIKLQKHLPQGLWSILWPPAKDGAQQKASSVSQSLALRVQGWEAENWAEGEDAILWRIQPWGSPEATGVMAIRNNERGRLGGGRGRCLYKWWERTNQVGEHPAGAVGRREGQHEKELRAGDVEQKQLLSVILVLAFFQAAPTSP